jgi:hypothetical protein
VKRLPARPTPEQRRAYLERVNRPTREEERAFLALCRPFIKDALAAARETDEADSRPEVRHADFGDGHFRALFVTTEGRCLLDPRFGPTLYGLSAKARTPVLYATDAGDKSKHTVTQDGIAEDVGTVPALVWGPPRTITKDGTFGDVVDSPIGWSLRTEADAALRELDALFRALTSRAGVRKSKATAALSPGYRRVLGKIPGRKQGRPRKKKK